jgi:hypothetical protein
LLGAVRTAKQTGVDTLAFAVAIFSYLINSKNQLFNDEFLRPKFGVCRLRIALILITIVLSLWSRSAGEQPLSDPAAAAVGVEVTPKSRPKPSTALTGNA